MNVSLCSVEQSTFKDVGPHAMFTQSFMKTDRGVSSWEWSFLKLKLSVWTSFQASINYRNNTDNINRDAKNTSATTGEAK